MKTKKTWRNISKKVKRHSWFTNQAQKLWNEVWEYWCVCKLSLLQQKDEGCQFYNDYYPLNK
jgi:hypothetical protein